MKITFLGPAGASFSALAYDRLAERFGAPRSDSPGAELDPVGNNQDVVATVIDHGGYGALAMETKAEGRVDPPVHSFIELLKRFDLNCPLKVIGAMPLRLHFALMARPGLRLKDLTKVVGHLKAHGACRGRIEALGVAFVAADSNGQAAEDVSSKEELKSAAALAPAAAAVKYGLEVLDAAFEDREAVTTFFLLGPLTHHTSRRAGSRALTVFRAEHVPGALIKVLLPIGDAGLNLRLIHSAYVEDGRYDFAVETELSADEEVLHAVALSRAGRRALRYLRFGPFPVIAGETL